MSEQHGTLHSQLRSRKRWPYFGLAAVFVVLAFAYIDGGEEPLHMIEQKIATPAADGANP